MMNYVWPVLIGFSFLASLLTGNLSELSTSVVDAAQSAVELLLRLLAMMCLWSGVMEIAEQAGITKIFSKLLSPVLRLIFPRLKNEKNALEAISMNISANILGIGNAATPLGIEAMRRLQEINGNTAIASDEMVVFVVMNTAALRLIPTTVATLRAQHGSANPMEILPATILTSVAALFVAISSAKLGNSLSNHRKRG